MTAYKFSRRHVAAHELWAAFSRGESMEAQRAEWFAATGETAPTVPDSMWLAAEYRKHQRGRRVYFVVQPHGGPRHTPARIAGPIGTLRDAQAVRALKIRQYGERAGLRYRAACEALRMGDGLYTIETAII